jgi:hypothetical protein
VIAPTGQKSEWMSTPIKLFPNPASDVCLRHSTITTVILTIPPWVEFVVTIEDGTGLHDAEALGLTAIVRSTLHLPTRNFVPGETVLPWTVGTVGALIHQNIVGVHLHLLRLLPAILYLQFTLGRAILTEKKKSRVICVMSHSLKPSDDF